MLEDGARRLPAGRHERRELGGRDADPLGRGRPLASLSRPGALPSAEISRRAHPLHRARRRPALCRHAGRRRRGEGRRGARDHRARPRRARPAPQSSPTNSPINDWVAIHTKQAPYRTYVIAGRVPRGSVPDALYWDTLDPYHYVRLQPGDAEGDWLIVGGEDHKTGQTDDAEQRAGEARSWARSLVPALGKIEYSLVGPGARTGRLPALQRQESGQRGDLRPHRRFRRGPDQRRGRVAASCATLVRGRKTAGRRCSTRRARR